MSNFFISDGWAVNIEQIVSIVGLNVRLKDGMVLEVSQQQASELIEFLKNSRKSDEVKVIHSKNQSAVVADGRLFSQTMSAPAMPPDAPQPCTLARP